MSTIVAVRKEGLVVIGTDTLSSKGTLLVSSKYQKNYDKVHKIKDSYIGVVGSVAHHNVIENIKKRYSKEIDLRNVDSIFETFLKLHRRLRNEYYVNVHEEKDQEYESNQLHALIVNPQGIFEIHSYREVMEYAKFWSIGSGCEYALGALYSVYDSHNDAAVIAEIALNAACEFDGPTGLPIKLYRIKLKK